MINLDDEVLNDYLDGNLSDAQKIEVKAAIENNKLMQMRYESLLAAHELFKQAKSEKVSNDFERKVMQRINRKNTLVKQQKRFMMIIFSLFGLLVLSIVGYALTEVISSLKAAESENIFSTFSIFLADYKKLLTNKNNLSLLGSILSFIMVISGYFLYEFQKKSGKSVR